MNDYKYCAAIVHNEKTIRDLYKTQYYAYDKVRIVSRFLLGFAMIITAAAFSIPLWAKGILLLIGAWLVSTPDFPAQVIAEKNISARKTSLPAMTYEFYNDFFTISVEGEGNAKFSYSKITLLIQDSNYLYLFIAKNSACMIDKSTLQIQIASDFVNFIEAKTKLKFRTQKSFISMNFQDLRKEIGI